ncbi:MAG: DUF3822 family protein [Paramuribaculum sp.]|nr:DUF3822 family protein [Paramuribaculum sp.]
MEHSRLEKDSIAQPELWSLLMVLSPGRLDVGLYPPVPREEMLWRSFRLDASASGGMLKALEETVYDNPLLFSDFRSVDCVVDTGWSMLVPPDIASEQVEILAEQVWGDDESRGELNGYPTGASNAVMYMSMEADVEAFLRRTFYNIKFTERKSALCRYFTTHAAGDNECKLYAVFDADRLTVIALDADRLQLANSFVFSSAADAAYYTLACAAMLGWDLQRCGIWYRGDMEQCDAYVELLRRYVPSVKPLPFPIMRYRVSKYIMNAPLDLLITGQCG